MHINRYCIWLVCPPRIIWSNIFLDVAQCLQSAFEELGYDVPIVNDPKDIRGRAIVLGVNMAPKYNVSIPDDAIIYNMEQAHEDSRWFSPEYGYLDILRSHMVWDFSPVNMQKLRNNGVTRIALCQMGYAPVLSRKKRAKEDIDVLFIGGGHPRRDHVLHDIETRGMRSYVGFECFGDARDALIARGKIHLNMHKEPAMLLEIPRMVYLLSNKCFVISERGVDRVLEEPLHDGAVFCDYDVLAQSCADYLVKPKLRKSIAEAGFDAIRKLPQTRFIEQALDEMSTIESQSLPKKIQATDMSVDTIFVAIASYRDPEVIPTIRNLLEMATDKHRIHVSVVVQANEDEPDCLVDPSMFDGKVTIVTIPHEQSKGANWARAEAMKARTDETHVLIIDSHMRFVSGWDVTLLDMLSRCPSRKPVISTYLPGYSLPNRLKHHPDQILRIRIKKITHLKDRQPVHLSGRFVYANEEERNGLYPTPFCIANFVFSRAKTFDEVPIDPRFVFWGDELNLSARLWTFGYDIFQADKPLAYHYWVRREHFDKMGYRMNHRPENQEVIDQFQGVMFGGDIADTEANRTYCYGSVRKIRDLWAFAGIDWHKKTYSERADNGFWNLLAYRNANAVEIHHKEYEHPRIFVQIASYRDPECQWTVKDLFEKAAHPERIFVGICWQFHPDEDQHLFEQPYPYPDQVRVHEVDSRDSKGACWARSLVQKLWRGEEYTLQIDSHMRFEEGWDTLLFETLDACDDPMAVLTCYAPGYEPPNNCEKNWVFGMSAKHFNEEGILHMHGNPAYDAKRNLPDKPINGAFLSANLLFGPSSILHDVPYDPYLYFFGEEITLAVRLWTSGYNIYHPNKLIIYHYWKRDTRRTHFDDHDKWRDLNARSFLRVKHLLDAQRSDDPDVVRDLSIYGLGHLRSLAEYEAFSGINFAEQTMQDHAKEGVFETPNKVHLMSKVRSDTRKFTVQLTDNKVEEVMAKKRNNNAPRIFVNIASYRDPECQWTVKDLFEKASDPDRIFVGICWQFDEEEDQACFQVSTRPDQVRVYPIDWREAGGVCWARHQAQQLWEDEEYTLMIDSHMRFQQNWDEDLIAELARCPADKPVISSSPAPYDPPDKLSTRLQPTVRRAKQFTPDGNVRCQGEALDIAPSEPLKGAFLVANFIFSKSEITSEVPYDPYLYFDQEEILYAAKLYTHGWTIYHPTRQFLYHFYNTKEAPGGSVRKLHWVDLRASDDARIRHLKTRGMRRMNHLTGYELTDDPDVTQELEKYGFGSVHSLEEFEAFSGVDFKNKVTRNRGLFCEFIEDFAKYRRRPFNIAPHERNAPEQARKAPVKKSVQNDAAKEPAQPTRKPNAAEVHQVNSGHGAAQQAATAQKVYIEEDAILQEVAKIEPDPLRPAPYNLLELGDYIPMFTTYNCVKAPFHTERLGGKYSVVAYISAEQPEEIRAFIVHLHEVLRRSSRIHVPIIIFSDDTAERLQHIRDHYNIKDMLYPDPDRRIARALGIAKTGNPILTTGFVLDQNMKILHSYRRKHARALAEVAADHLVLALDQYKKRSDKPKVYTHNAPALIVPNVLTPEMCSKVIDAFKNGKQFDGTVGSGKNKALRQDIKIRTDHIMTEKLMHEIDDKFSRSFFPELRKVFGVEITHRESYKVGLYKGDNAGFFMPHRDNSDLPMGYRRIASTIHLNEDYEGGGLRFPEYGPDIYRPEAGAGIAFSASTVHEALPVTQGERYVIVAFMHGKQDEAYRHYYRIKNNEPVRHAEFTPVIRSYPELQMWRQFYTNWMAQVIRMTGDLHIDNAQNIQQPLPEAANLNVPNAQQAAPRSLIIKPGAHKPKKVFETEGGAVYDDFLPEDVYEAIYQWALKADYEYINTTGKVNRAWHINDGFPLRTTSAQFYSVYKPEKKERFDYPTGQVTDRFMDALLEFQPNIERLVGKKEENWKHVSLTSWLYPTDTGLSLHDDGSGVYTGAYAFFLNPVWRAHWGGLLLMMDDEASKRVHEFREQNNQMDFYQKKFLHSAGLDELLLETGMARCIFPKRNRIAFIANSTYHMITRVNESAGDNVRMSLAGFYNRNKR